ncbi:hypothetical protein RND71_034639 [Anisodus tanguticus]|uniref:Uncharacterized protein n=1 Tax=Anisodus tanguticus TaxID=243964 RepID=A0AAE1R3Y6_9SOLA|nr:hypothetical protein RND71_034639 [Anisodus tanguticus]
MGKGRAHCCDKSKVKKGPWTHPEDLKLISFIQKNGHGNWRALPKQADVKRGNFTPQEEDTILKLHHTFGNRWSKIASHLPGRTDNEIKNVWNTHLKKRILKKEEYCNMKNNSCASSPSSIHQDDHITSSQEELGDHNKGQHIDTLTAGSCSPTTTTSSYASLNVDQFSMDMIEIPDIDFSDMLDDIPINLGLDDLDYPKLDSTQYPQLPPAQYTSQGSSDEYDQCQKWMRYFEIELGLTTSNNEQCCDGFTSSHQNNAMQV